MLAELPRLLVGATASGIERSAIASRSSLTTARKNAATGARGAFSGRGGLSGTRVEAGCAVSVARGNSGVGSTTTPSGRRGPSGRSGAVAKPGPFDWRDPHAAEAAARDATSKITLAVF